MAPPAAGSATAAATGASYIEFRFWAGAAAAFYTFKGREGRKKT